MNYPKRLIEVDLPIKRISAHARREKSIRHGHMFTLPIFPMCKRPEVYAIRNPARPGWKPIVKVEHCACAATSILTAEEERNASEGVKELFHTF